MELQRLSQRAHPAAEAVDPAGSPRSPWDDVLTSDAGSNRPIYSDALSPTKPAQPCSPVVADGSPTRAVSAFAAAVALPTNAEELTAAITALCSLVARIETL